MRKYIDKKLFLILLGYMAAYHVVYIFRRIILKAIGHEAYKNIDWGSIAIQPILVNFIIVPPVIILVLIVGKIMINHKVKKIYLVVTHFALFLIYTTLITFFAGIYHYFVFDYNLFKEGFFIHVLFGSNLNFLGYIGFVTIMYSYYYIQKVSRMETQELKLSQQLQFVKMQALKSQLNPHFLFNTLHGISSLVKDNPNKAQNMIGSLGGLLREVLLIKDKNLVRVRKEMTILSKYLEIMQTRFSDHLSIEIDIDKNVEEALIPSMLLQPIMENSFEHGYSYDSINLKVNLSISKIDTWLMIRVQNNGAPISGKNDELGMGISNIQERLKTLYGDNFDFSFSNLEKEGGVITRIKIPLIFDLEKLQLG